MIHVRHLGFADRVAYYLIRGWRILGWAEPVSPVCDCDVWMAIGPCPVGRRA